MSLRPHWTTLFVAVAMALVGCAHTPQPERKVYVISDTTNDTGGAGADAYCNEIQKQCFNKCWRRKPEIAVKKHSAEHYNHCESKCLKVFMDCAKEQEELERQESKYRKQEFHFENMDTALGWLREHKTEAVLGTVVVVGGVIAVPYAIAIVGGALVLTPL